VLSLAVGDQGQVYFVTLDPVGSFMWLEQQCLELRMCEALAERLMNGASDA